jgi:hypothetical protein
MKMDYASGMLAAMMKTPLRFLHQANAPDRNAFQPLTIRKSLLSKTPHLNFTRTPLAL